MQEWTLVIFYVQTGLTEDLQDVLLPYLSLYVHRI